MHKKLIICLTVSAFAAISSLQAADSQKPAADANAPAAVEKKTTTSDDALKLKSVTIADKAKETAMASDDCCSDGSCKPARKIAMSPRAMDLLR